MKKTQSEKKLSIDIVTLRKLDSELTPEQLQAVLGGGRGPKPTSGPGTIIRPSAAAELQPFRANEDPMKKTQSEKKLSIDIVTLRKLDSELTPEQLQAVAEARPGPSRPAGPARSSRASPAAESQPLRANEDR